MTDPQQSAILSPLAAIRRRLYIVRLTERAALALTLAATAALFVVGGRLLYPRYPALGIAVSLLPLIPAAWLFLKAGRLAHPSSTLAVRGNLEPRHLQIAAILMAAIAAVAVVILTAKLLVTAPLWAFPTAIAGLFLIVAAATVKPVQPKAAAIFVDQQVGLKERVSTALEMLQTSPQSSFESAFREPVIASAIDACQTIRNAKVGYAKIDRRVYALAATVAIAAVGISLLTPLTAHAGPAARKYLPVVQKGTTLAEKLAELEATKKIEDPAAQKKLAELRKVAEAMKQGNMSPFEANEKLSTLSKELQNQKDANDSADVEKALEASKEMQGLADAARDLKESTLKSSSGSTPGGKMNTEQAKASVDKAAGDIAGKLDGMSQKEKNDLAGDLQKAADKAKDPELKEALQQASKSASQGNSQGLKEGLSKAGQCMGEGGAKQQMSQQAIRDAMAEIERAQGGGSSAAEQQAKGNGGDQQQGGSQQGGGQEGGQEGQQGGDQQQQAGGQGGQGGQEGQGGDGAGQQAGGGKQGGGNQSGQQEGAGQSASSGGDGGSGSTNFFAPGGPGSKEQGNRIGKSETFVRIYDQKPIDSRGSTEHTRGHINPLGTPSGSIETYDLGDKTEPTIRRLEDELPAARRRALDDLPNQPIPPQMKDLIRRYYDK